MRSPESAGALSGERRHALRRAQARSPESAKGECIWIHRTYWYCIYHCIVPPILSYFCTHGALHWSTVYHCIVHHSISQCISYFVLFLYSWCSINGITYALHIAQVRSPESAGTLTGERKRKVYLDSRYILVLYISVLYLLFCPISVLMVLYIALLYITVLYITVYLNVSPILSYVCTHGIVHHSISQCISYFVLFLYSWCSIKLME